jgi:NAD(P)-dependent dehydrogenase (short-subunit alcohol dehydrogenase family)
VVSNAGYGLMGAAEELTDEQVRHQIDTNLVGSIQRELACSTDFPPEEGDGNARPWFAPNGAQSSAGQ